MRPDARSCIDDAILALETVRTFTAGESAVNYAENAMLRAAVEREFIIVGESLSRFRRLEPEAAAQTPGLAEAVALRNVLVHGYATVNRDVMWLTVTDDAPLLLARLLELRDPDSE